MEAWSAARATSLSLRALKRTIAPSVIAPLAIRGPLQIMHNSVGGSDGAKVEKLSGNSAPLTTRNSATLDIG